MLDVEFYSEDVNGDKKNVSAYYALTMND